MSPRNTQYPPQHQPSPPPETPDQAHQGDQLQLDGVWSNPLEQIDSQTSFGTSMQYLQTVDEYVPA